VVEHSMIRLEWHLNHVASVILDLPILVLSMLENVSRIVPRP
jgi:hypothetical protein